MYKGFCNVKIIKSKVKLINKYYQFLDFMKQSKEKNKPLEKLQTFRNIFET